MTTRRRVAFDRDQLLMTSRSSMTSKLRPYSRAVLSGGGEGAGEGDAPAHTGVSRYLANLASRQKYSLDGMWRDNEVRL